MSDSLLGFTRSKWEDKIMTLLLAITLVSFLLGGGLCTVGVMVRTHSKLALVGAGLLGLGFWGALSFWVWVLIL